MQPPLAQAGSGSSGNEFNPAASLILTGTYGQQSEDPANYQIGGFIPTNGEVGPPGRSFQLGESELTLSANVDPYFSGYFVGAFEGDDGTSVEEAFVSHVGLIPGATMKFGRFLCRRSATSTKFTRTRGTSSTRRSRYRRSSAVS